MAETIHDRLNRVEANQAELREGHAVHSVVIEHLQDATNRLTDVVEALGQRVDKFARNLLIGAALVAASMPGGEAVAKVAQALLS